MAAGLNYVGVLCVEFFLLAPGPDREALGPLETPELETARVALETAQAELTAAREAIARVAAKPDLSNDVREVVTRALAD